MLIAAYRAQGSGGPRYAAVAPCFADGEEAARATAHRFFRWSLSGWPALADLPDPSNLAATRELATPQAVARAISCGPSAERHLEAIGRYIDAGFGHIILARIRPDQESLFRLFERELAPAPGRRAVVTGVSS